MAQWTKPMTMREVAKLLGWGNDRAAKLRVLRLLKRTQRETGVQLLTWVGGSRGYTTTVALLRKHLPELVDGTNDVLRVGRALSGQLREMRTELEAAQRRFLESSGT